MSEVNKISTQIGSRRYTVSAPESEEYIQKVCSYVDEKISEIASLNLRFTADMSAVLAAITITEELFKSQAETDSLRKQILSYGSDSEELERKVRSLEAQIDKQKREIEIKDKELESYLKKKF